MYISLTSHGYLKKQGEPLQALWNKLNTASSLEILPNLYRLETASICRILFKKVSILPKGRFLKQQGSICNIPIESDHITNVLPRGADSNLLLVVKLKRKLP